MWIAPLNYSKSNFFLKHWFFLNFSWSSLNFYQMCVLEILIFFLNLKKNVQQFRGKYYFGKAIPTIFTNVFILRRKRNAIDIFRLHSCIHRYQSAFFQCIVYQSNFQYIFWSLKCSARTWLLIGIKSAMEIKKR